jgi:hypothetical protein
MLKQVEAGLTGKLRAIEDLLNRSERHESHQSDSAEDDFTEEDDAILLRAGLKLDASTSGGDDGDDPDDQDEVDDE